MKIELIIKQVLTGKSIKQTWLSTKPISTRPMETQDMAIQFTLVVDNFGVKYTQCKDILHLQQVLEQNYKITSDWTGTGYIGFTLHWDYTHARVHLSMPEYIAKTLKQFQQTC